jgi:sugar lactone lactonase YvrE
LSAGPSWAWSARTGIAGAAIVAVGAAIGASPAAAIPPSPYVISAFAGTGNPGVPTAGAAASSDLNSPYGDAVDAQGNVYIGDLGNHMVDEVSAAGDLSVIGGGGSGPITPGLATSTTLPAPTGVAVGGDGTVYVADYPASLVYKISPTGVLSIVAGTGSSGQPTPGPATSSELAGPYAVAADASGDVFIADTGNNVIEKVTPAGVLSIVAGTGMIPGPGPPETETAPIDGPALSSNLESPEGVALDASGNVYIGDAINNVIEKVTPSGMLSVVAGTGTPGSPTPGPATSSDLDNPAGLSLDAAGNVYVADVANDDIEEIAPSGTLSVIAGDNAPGGVPSYGVSATDTDLDGPAAVASTPAGRLYIADAVNNTIDLLAPPKPVNTTPPSVTGTFQAGQTLSATRGSWSQDPIIYSYQWQDCDAAGASCADLPRATDNTYTLASSDAGATVRVVVTAENGGGAGTAVASVSAVIADVPKTKTTPTPTTAAGVDQTTASRKVRGQWAVLGGLVAANNGPVSYRFQYGPTKSYTNTSTTKTLTASTTDRAVTMIVRRLLPGTVYHFRLVVTDAAGGTRYGSDRTLKTRRVIPRRVRDHIYSFWDQHAPYGYRVHGRMVLPPGLSHAAACQTRGTVTITATTAHKLIARHRVNVSAGCRYASTFRLSTTQLPGSGRASFSMRFGGNQQLQARQARTLNVLYGPGGKQHR